MPVPPRQNSLCLITKDRQWNWNERSGESCHFTVMDLSAKILGPYGALSLLSNVHSSGAIEIRIRVEKTRPEN